MNPHHSTPVDAAAATFRRRRPAAASRACAVAAAAALALGIGFGGSAARAAEPGGSTTTGGPVQPVVVRAVATFGFDRATLRPGDRDALLADVAKMKDVTWQQISTIGHTDGIGSAAYNEKLSARRAEAVKSYLVAKGIDGSMIATEAKAATAPAADNDTPAGRAKNRRTEVEFRGVRPAGN